MENDDNAGAKAAFRLALEQDANDFEANLRLGAILRMQNEHAAALPYIEKALRLRPASLPARYQKAALLVAMGRLEEALPLLEALVEESPSFTEAHLQLAQVYFRLGRREDGQRQRAIVLELQEKERQASRPKP
jgi:tetratricopeptide (TPR) repeat protein